MLTRISGAFVALTLSLFGAGYVPDVSMAGTGTTPTQDQVNGTYALTYGLVAYRLKLPRLGEFPAPIIEFKPHVEMCAAVGQDPGCPVGGYQQERRIVLRDDYDWSNAATMSILAHEFVHYFQYISAGHMAVTVCEAYAREIDAYGVQLEIMLKAHVEGWAVSQVDFVGRAMQRMAREEGCE